PRPAPLRGLRKRRGGPGGQRARHLRVVGLRGARGALCAGGRRRAPHPRHRRLLAPRLRLMWRWVVICVAVGFGAVVTRGFWDGRAALAAGDAALARGDVDEALVGWRRAARWYAPFAGHVDDAYDRMANLAREAEGHGDRARALAAWRAIRSSVL